MQQEKSHGQNVNERAWLSSKETLLVDAEIWISCDFHMSKEILLIYLFFPNHFKIIRIFVSSSQRKAGSVIDWPLACSLQTPAMEA